MSQLPKLKLWFEGSRPKTQPAAVVPVIVGNPIHTKKLSDLLLVNHRIYVQPINFPTVPRGTERLRFTPSPIHGSKEIDYLVDVMNDLWSHCALNRTELSA